MVERWFKHLGEIWAAKDPDAIRGLLSDSFEYYEDPHRPPLTTADAVIDEWRAVKKQDIIRLDIKPLIIKDLEGFAKYSFAYRDPDGVEHKSEGAYFVKLDDEGKALEFRQWWNSR